MTPLWAPEAINDLAALRAYIERDDPAAAQRVALHVIHNIEALLANSPEMGRPGRVPGTRELAIPRTSLIVTRPNDLPDRVEAGEEIIIARDKQPVAKLVPVRRVQPKRQFGAMRGRARVEAAFFEPLPPDELRTWE